MHDVPKDRRKAMRSLLGRLFKAIARELASTGVDFEPAIVAFEQSFDNPDEQ